MNRLLEAALASAIKGDLLWNWNVQEYKNGFSLVTYQTYINNVSYGGGLMFSNSVLSSLFDPGCTITLIQRSVQETELQLREAGIY